MKLRPVLLTFIGLLLVLLAQGAFSQVRALSYGDLVARLQAAGATVSRVGPSRPTHPVLSHRSPCSQAQVAF